MYYNKVYMVIICYNIDMNQITRFEKAQHIAEIGHIHQFQDDRSRFLVQSESDKERCYMVTVDKDFECCTCPDSQIRGDICKHLLAVCIRYTKVM
jgi:hypothetical protein